MTDTFLNYYKVILLKVSFDKNLFMKEYKKANNILGEKDIEHLNNWLKETGLLPIDLKSPEVNKKYIKKKQLWRI